MVCNAGWSVEPLFHSRLKLYQQLLTGLPFIHFLTFDIHGSSRMTLPHFGDA